MNIQPLSQDDVIHLFSHLKNRQGLLLAISGGADSLSLLPLMALWKKMLSEGPIIRVATVDHGLRSAAREEGGYVGKCCAQYGFEHEILFVREKAPHSDIQAWARRQRYRLLAMMARKWQCDTIVTAHHMEDQAETFMIRLARGSGVQGLGAIAPSSFFDELCLERPLLTISKQRLVKTVQHEGLQPVCDPSNDDNRFQRARLRSLMPVLESEGLSARRLALTAKQLRRADDALQQMMYERLIEHGMFDCTGFMGGESEKLLARPDEIALRVLRWAVMMIGGAYYPSQLEQLEMILSVLRYEKKVKRTLGGALFSQEDGLLRIYREAGRQPLPTIELEAGAHVIWDNRFIIKATCDAPRALIAPLANYKHRSCYGDIGKTIPHLAWITMPSIVINDEIYATPFMDNHYGAWQFLFPRISLDVDNKNMK